MPMQCAIVDLKSRQGIVTPNVAMIDTPVTLILADGNMDLEKERLDLRMMAKPKNVSPFTVRSPILVKGTFLNPDVSLEAGPIAARAIGAVALAFVNPLAAILPFLDPGAGDQEASCSQALAELKNPDGKSPAKPPAKKQTEPVKTPVGEPEGRIPGM